MAAFHPTRMPLLAVAFTWLITAASPAPASAHSQAVAADPPAVSLSGFVSASLFTQNALYGPGNGQSARFLELDQPERDAFWHGGDVRNTRVIVTATSSIEGWDLTGFLESDFFGGFAAGAFAREQALPRIRLAYVEGTRGGTTVRLGQDWAPIYGFVPESEMHIAFPLGYGSAGLIGWRFPGVFVEQRISAPDAPTQLSFEVAAMRGAWDDEDNPELPTAGQVALIPQLQARINVGAAETALLPWDAFVAGHYDRKDLRGLEAGDPDWLDGWAVTAGFRVEPDPVVILSTIYAGRAMGHHSGHISQFGDLRGLGGFVQTGIHLADRWSVWFFGGVDSVEEDELQAGDRTQNIAGDAMLRYAAGPLGVGLNWTVTRTSWLNDDRDRFSRTGHQIGLSTTFSF